MPQKIDLSVVIPAFLEEENLRVLLPRLARTLAALKLKAEVLVVDTNPPRDHTPLVCREARVRHIPREGGDSYGAAVRTGIAHTLGRRILFMDADGSHSPEFIRELWAQEKSAHVVTASRYVAGGATENKRSLIWMSQALNGVYTLVLGLRCKDISNSFKLYPGEAMRGLALRCDHFDIVEEILIKLSLAVRPLAIKEVPFVFKKRMFGETKRNLAAFILSFAVTLIRLSWIKWTFRLGPKRQAQGSPRAGE